MEQTRLNLKDLPLMLLVNSLVEYRVVSVKATKFNIEDLNKVRTKQDACLVFVNQLKLQFDDFIMKTT